ncbi:MAG: YcjX family protein [Planctomycetes bacterium]|nr:YcjX family protein [Planctomycetota bacterium]
MRWLDHKRKIAITGLAGSGKTVFLLSLLQHIEQFDPHQFPIGGMAELGNFRERRVNSKYTKLPRAQLRAKMIESRDIRWPEKTRDVYGYACSFDYSQLGLPTRLVNTVLRRAWLSRDVVWEFLDFPGERLADVPIAEATTFEDWSDAMIQRWTIDQLMEEYRALMAATPPPPAAALLACYKQGLTAQIHQKKQFITPSTFMLDHETGSQFGRSDFANQGRDRVTGLPNAEFAPLSEAYRTANPELTSQFANHFAHYRKTVVLPLRQAINGCDTLLVLIDIPGILSGGSGRYNDAVDLLLSLAGIIHPSGWFTTNVDKAAFIATKADMVHESDNDHLAELLKSMMRQAKSRQSKIRYEPFTASAWVCAESLTLTDGSKALRGITAWDGASNVFRVPSVPEKWPDHWEPEDPRFSFPRLLPPRLTNRFQAPKQRGLEHIFDFIIS